MGAVKKFGLVAGAALLTAGSVIGYRTVTFSSIQGSAVNDIKLAAAPAFDIRAAAANLGKTA